MPLSSKFISCDWGTTNLRLSIVEREDFKVIEHLNRQLGVKTLFEGYLKQKELSQKDFFSKFLSTELDQFKHDIQGYPIVISGMASSSIGLQEMHYAEMPFSIDGAKLLHEKINLGSGRKGILVSGARDESGVMRGEEVQAIGLGDHLVRTNAELLILPGSHSKHITFRGGQYTCLSTFMTGELFQILAEHSILSKSLRKIRFSEKYATVFKQGLRKGINNEMSTSLFTIRVDDLFSRREKESNYFYLSGLLIGEELRYLNNSERKVCLAASGSLNKLYKIALGQVLPRHNFEVLDESAIQLATFKGQLKILRNYE